jgi:hypothetical protein
MGRISTRADGEGQAVTRQVNRDRRELQQNRENIANVDRLRDLEDIITRGMMTFQEVGYALMEIRDQKLWKPFFASFDDYCWDRWKYGAKQGNNMIRAAKTAEVVPVKNEAIAREFAKLAEEDPEKAREVFNALCSINPDHTAREAAAFIRDPQPALPPKPSDDYIRRTKSYIDNMLAKFDDEPTGAGLTYRRDWGRRQRYLMAISYHVQEQMYLAFGARRIKPKQPGQKPSLKDSRPKWEYMMLNDEPQEKEEPGQQDADRGQEDSTTTN